jgi:hypothetical protein
MKSPLLITCLNLLFIISCGQKEVLAQNKEASNWIPYLTKNNDFIYVDSNLKKQISTSYKYADKFTETGFAIVSNQEGKSAIIDASAKIIVDYTDHEMEMTVVQNLTLLMIEYEYEKKMPFWKYDWNIMGGDIKKTKNYKKTEVKVLETNQVLFDQDVPYLEDPIYLSPIILDETHFVLHNTLFEIKKNKIVKLNNQIGESLEGGRYIPKSKSTFQIYSSKNQKPIISDLVGTDKITIMVNNKPFVLDSINQDRYSPEIPKVLQNSKTQEIYTYPQYDKTFPKEIKNATPEQIKFLEKTSLIYSLNNSHYFILGRFNFDHDIWTYDWLYVDEKGQLFNEINAENFYILDQIGYLVWPDKNMLLPQSELDKMSKIGKIKYIYKSENLYIINAQYKDKELRKGLWNAKSKTWELQPEYFDINVLEVKNKVFALQKEEKGQYTLFNNKTKQQIGTKTYDNIYSSGWVLNKAENKSYFIDLLIGKEYKE